MFKRGRECARRAGSLLAVAVLMVACSDPEPAPTLPEHFWRSPEGAAQSVFEARSSAKPGDTVTVRGRVKEFYKSAGFTMVDTAIKSCAEECDSEKGGCPTPWDYCCADADEVRHNTVNVEFRDGSLPLAVSAKGFHGLDHLDIVVVSGQVERDEKQNVILVASAITKAQ